MSIIHSNEFHFHPGLPGSKLHVTSVARYAPLLHRYTLNETEKELQLLLAAERLSEALDHPPGELDP